MANQQLELTLDTARRPERSLELTRDFVADLKRHDAVKVESSNGPPVAGERGGVDQIVLTFLTAGAATALIDCLKAYIVREPSLHIRLKRKDGAEIGIDSKSLGSDTVAATLNAVQRLVE